MRCRLCGPLDKYKSIHFPFANTRRTETHLISLGVYILSYVSLAPCDAAHLFTSVRIKLQHAEHLALRVATSKKHLGPRINIKLRLIHRRVACYAAARGGINVAGGAVGGAVHICVCRLCVQ